MTTWTDVTDPTSLESILTDVKLTLENQLQVSEKLLVLTAKIEKHFETLSGFEIDTEEVEEELRNTLVDIVD